MPDATPETTKAAPKLSGVEHLKLASHGLRGRLAEELAEGGIQVSEDAYNLLKFHGSYEQFDRDTATARKQAKLEKEYQFMLRVRMPGGRLTASQYLVLDQLADQYANATLRITTRQGIQFHGIAKGELKPTIAAINQTLLTTLCACGDVVRNVMTSPAPRTDHAHRRIEADAVLLSEALLPKSRAYHQIFLDEPEDPSVDETETLYGATYLPRKFKIGIALPEDNTVDVLTNDLGFVAIFEGRELRGYNVAVGGGLGMTHNKPRTFPRIADFIGFVGPDDLLGITEAVIRVQRDHGDRGDRKRARLKYLVADHGVAWIRARVEDEYGAPLAQPAPVTFAIPDLLGWHEQGDGRLWLGVPVPSGRIADADSVRLRNALRYIVTRFGVDPIMTPQQDVLLSNVSPADRDAIEAVLREHDVPLAEDLTPLSRWALACPALPTCGLALTEAERIRPALVTAVDAALARHGLSNRRISFRITGCPNGCARTYTGDIGLVGRMPGFYALYVGGDFEGTRLSFKLVEKLAEAAVVPTLEALFAAYARSGLAGEGFGDWCFRTGAETLLAGLETARAA